MKEHLLRQYILKDWLKEYTTIDLNFFDKPYPNKIFNALGNLAYYAEKPQLLRNIFEQVKQKANLDLNKQREALKILEYIGYNAPEATLDIFKTMISNKTDNT
ncbi:MAG: hypothetical protein LBV04_02735, partial [Deferribacteraceae bacterium]|nr:hypothetical protein [Deferribacteraceae bacterium]